MKKWVGICFLLMNMISYAYINLYPIKFEKDITKGNGEEFVLYNRTMKKIKYRIYVEERKGYPSMAEWIEIYPKSLTIEPLKEEKIKIYIQPPHRSMNGDYFANLVIKEVAVPKIEKDSREKKTKVMTNVKLRLKGRIRNE